MKKLTPTHPLYRKVEALQNFLQANELQIIHTRFGGLMFIDSKTNVEADLRDVDDNEHLSEFPVGFEFKLTLPEY